MVSSSVFAATFRRENEGSFAAQLAATRLSSLFSPISDIVHLGLHLCSALHYLHRHDVLHLDLKPSNIVSESRLAKVIDLSIARPPGRGKEGAGTIQYMAPEQILGGFVSPATSPASP